MKTSIYLISFVITLCLLLIISDLFIINKNSIKNQVIFENNKALNIELAKTSNEWETGLMFRKSLDENNGMLFI